MKLSASSSNDDDDDAPIQPTDAPAAGSTTNAVGSWVEAKSKGVSSGGGDAPLLPQKRDHASAPHLIDQAWSTQTWAWSTITTTSQRTSIDDLPTNTTPIHPQQQ